MVMIYCELSLLSAILGSPHGAVPGAAAAAVRALARQEESLMPGPGSGLVQAHQLATGCLLLGLIIDGPGTTTVQSTVVPWGPFTLPQDTVPPQQPHYNQFVLPSPSIISVLDQPRLNIFIIDFFNRRPI